MKVVAVTSCATGIAHTYMAAEAIMKVCKERGYKCAVCWSLDDFMKVLNEYFG